MKFLEQINRQANGELTEGLWDDVKSNVTTAAKALVGVRPTAPAPVQAPPNPHDTADAARKHIVDGLEDFSASVQHVASGSHYRVIVFCRKNWLVSDFMSSPDGKGAIAGLSDPDFTALFNDFTSKASSLGSSSKTVILPPASSRNFVMHIYSKGDLSLQEQIENPPFGDIAIFLEIPKSQFAKLSTATNIDDQRKSFGHLFNHHFYMFAVWPAVARSIQPYTDPATGTAHSINSTEMKIIDPKMIIAHRTPGMVAKLKREWDEVWSPAALTKKTKDEGDAAAAAADEADNKKISADTAKDILKTKQANAAKELAAASTTPSPSIIDMSDFVIEVNKTLARYPKDPDNAVAAVKTLAYSSAGGSSGFDKPKYEKYIDKAKLTAKSLGRSSVASKLDYATP